MPHRNANATAGNRGKRKGMGIRAETQTVGALDKRPKYSTGKVEKDTTQ